MPRFLMLAVNPARAVLDGTEVPTAALTRALRVHAGSEEEALALAGPRARRFGFRPVAVVPEGAALLAPGAFGPAEDLFEAFPTDPALAGDEAFAVPGDAAMLRAGQPGDVMSNAGTWDLPIRSVTADGETLPLHRRSKVHAPTGYGFGRGAVDEAYETRDGGEPLLVEVRRDERTLAARAIPSAQARHRVPPDVPWFHSLGRDEAAAAGAVAAAIRRARGLEHLPAPAPAP